MRAPAHSSLSPKLFEWAPITSSILQPVVSEYSLQNAIIESVVTEKEDDHRYFRIRLKPGATPTLFVKIVPLDQCSQANLLTEITNDLISNGINTPRIIDTIFLETKLAAEIYNWSEGDYPNSSNAHLKIIGRSIRGFHNALKNKSRRHLLKKQTDDRICRLIESATAPSFRKFWSGRQNDTIAYRYRDLFLAHTDLIVANRTPTHGDLNPGNILISRDQKKVTFLDLEDTLHSVVWPGCDIAKIVERILLPMADRIGKNVLNLKIETLLDSYQNNNQNMLNEGHPLSPSLLTAVEWLLGINFVLLSTMEKLDYAICDLEIEKFLEVHRMVSENSDVLMNKWLAE